MFRNTECRYIQYTSKLLHKRVEKCFSMTWGSFHDTLNCDCDIDFFFFIPLNTDSSTVCNSCVYYANLISCGVVVSEVIH